MEYDKEINRMFFSDMNKKDVKSIKEIRLYPDNTINYVIFERLDSRRIKMFGNSISDELKNYIKEVIRDEKIKTLLNE